MAESRVLARKWRPRTFTEVVGQPHVVRALTNALDTSRLHHAYLFTGTRGVGKTTLARILAKCLNCESGITSQPCGTCSACRDIDSGRFPDILEVDAATNTRVEEMRDLLDNAQYMPTSGRFKVYIIDEVHMLSRSAFNSMLKTLEEPPDHVKFVLATTDPQKVPVTVLSRCLQFNLKQMSPDLIVERLSHILQEEGIEFDLPSLGLIARAAQGSMRDSLSLLDQAIAFGSGRLVEAEVSGMLGAIDRAHLVRILEALANQDAATMMAVAQEMSDRSLSFEAALQEMAVLIHDVILARALPQKRELMGISADVEPLTGHWDPETLQLFYQILIQSRHDLFLAPDELSGFRMALMRLLAFAPAMPQGAAVAATPVPPAAAPVKPAAKAPAAAPVVSAAPATAPAAPAPTAANTHRTPLTQGARRVPPSIGDWGGLVSQLTRAGLAYELARNCQLERYEQGVLYLTLDGAQKHLSRYSGTLRTSLESLLDADLKLDIQVSEEELETQARLQARAEEARQQSALNQLRQDPAVQALQSLGGKLVESTVRSVEQNSNSQ
jgi:DNA polymerase-3 subunit gamma/tau